MKESELSVDVGALQQDAEYFAKQLQELECLTSSVKTGIELASLSGELGVQVLDSRLAEGIDNAEGLTSHAHAIVGVNGGDQRSEESREDGHVLGLVGGGAGDETETEILSKPQSAIVVGDKTGVVGVVGRSNVSNEGAGDAIEK